MSIHWAQAITMLWFLALPVFLLTIGGYALLALRQKMTYAGYGSTLDTVVSDGEHQLTGAICAPFIVLTFLSVSTARAWGGYGGLGQVLVTSQSAALATTLVIVMAFVLYTVGSLGGGWNGRLLRYGFIDARVFIFWAWGFLLMGVHATNILSCFLVLELFNTCALLVLVLEGGAVEGSTKKGFLVVSGAIMVFFWISVMSTFATLWGLGLLVSTGVSLGGVVRIDDMGVAPNVLQQALLGLGMGMKGGIPPLGWWLMEFYTGLTTDQLATYISSLYIPLLVLALYIGFGFGGYVGVVEQLGRQGIAVGAVLLVFNTVGIRTIRAAIALSTLVSLALLGAVVV